MLEGYVAAWQGCAPQCVPQGAHCMAATNITLVSSLKEVKPWTQTQLHVMLPKAAWLPATNALFAHAQCGT